MSINKNDSLIIVDIFDREKGLAGKEEIHQYGILHRAFSVFIYQGTRMLIQRRAFDKYHSGGLWANACCSHPKAGEETKEAAKKRLIEEVGIHCSIREIFSFVYRHQFTETLFEYEFDHVFLGEYHGEVKPNSKEVEELKWVEFSWLAKDLEEHPEKYAAWFLIAAPKILKEIIPK